jgi:glycosyltransferase involved in cell wall biosynthesis
MTSRPLISIVLPTYNGSRYLSQSIESCLRQNLTDWELIIVDDASTDRTPDLIQQYAAQDRRIRPFRNAVNSKLPKSLNFGFAQARGELLTWTSDDNCYRPEALATMRAYLDTNPAVDLVYTGYTVIDDDDRPTKSGPPGAGPLRDLPFRNVVGACFLYRRTIHEQLGGYAEDLFLVEDYDFWLRASTQFNLRFLDQDLYLYRWHGQSLTLQQPAKVRLAREKALARNLGQMGWLERSTRAKAWKQLIDQAVTRRDRAAARSHFRHSLANDPLMAFRVGFDAMAFTCLPRPLLRWFEWLEEMRHRRRLKRAAQEIQRLIPAEQGFILVDEEQLRPQLQPSRATPFLEKDGAWWGAPDNDDTALRELERLREAGASHIVFAWPSFWWLDYYQTFHRELRTRYRCVLENKRVVVFSLKRPLLSAQNPGAMDNHVASG